MEHNKVKSLARFTENIMNGKAQALTCNQFGFLIRGLDKIRK
jgi:hypothetical protein